MTFAALLLLVLGATCFLARVIVGPSLADRVVAIDGLVVSIVGIILVHSIRINSHLFLGVAAVVALVGFVGAVAGARFIERRGA